MSDQVVQVRGLLVDALREYKQPTMVYLPLGPSCEAAPRVVWVSTIITAMMEMYLTHSLWRRPRQPEAIVADQVQE